MLPLGFVPNKQIFSLFDLVSVDGFSKIGETAGFVDHVGGRVEAKIMRGDRAFSWLHDFGVQREGVRYRLVLVETHLRGQRRKCCVRLIHV